MTETREISLDRIPNNFRRYTALKVTEHNSPVLSVGCMEWFLPKVYGISEKTR